jgi:hypothetical protein
MKKLVAVCLGVVLSSSALSARSSSSQFALAERFGQPNARTFFVFSTAAGKYIVRHDGFGEFTSPKKWRRVFKLGVPQRERINSVYFVELESDVLVLYEVSGQGAYLVRMEQTKRKLRWSTRLDTSNVEAPILDGNLVVVKDGERSFQISKTDGRIL